MPTTEYWTLISGVATSVLAGGAYVGRQLGALRQATTEGQGKLAGLVADWLDEQDEHTDQQDDAIAELAHRVGQLETHAGLASPPYARVRRRRVRPRRLDATVAGLEVPSAPSPAQQGAEGRS